MISLIEIKNGFYSDVQKIVKLRKKEHCSQCNEELPPKYMPMSEWKIKGPLCGKCYSEQISQFYPGDHVRVNKTE